jgi:hypothetical protein
MPRQQRPIMSRQIGVEYVCPAIEPGRCQYKNVINMTAYRPPFCVCRFYYFLFALFCFPVSPTAPLYHSVEVSLNYESSRVEYLPTHTKNAKFVPKGY